MSQASFSSEGFADYSAYGMTHEYEADPGYVSVPLAGDSEAFVTIRIHGGFGIRTVNWIADRSGRPPIIPSLTANGTITGQDLIHDYSINVSQTPNPDKAGFNWSTSGTYRYVQQKARIPGRDMFPTNYYPFPVEPTTSQAQYALTVAGFAMDATSGALLNSLGNSINHNTNDFLWPFTHIPASFANDNLVTTLASTI